MAYKQMYQDNKANNILEDGNSHSGEEARVSFNETDNVKISTEKLQPANVKKRFLLNEPTAMLRNISNKIKIAEKNESDKRISGLYRASSRIERLAMPLARWRKPFVRLTAITKSKLKNYDYNKNVERIMHRQNYIIFGIIYLPKTVNRKLSRLNIYHLKRLNLKRIISIDLTLLDKSNERMERVTT